MKIGSYVEILYGDYIGHSGLIININSNSLSLYPITVLHSDNRTKEYIEEQIRLLL